jgi:predicted kinase
LKKHLLFTVGLPRSGKTTLRNYLKDAGVKMIVVSADELRELVYGQRFYGLGENFVWGVREILLHTLMDQGHTIFIDETNTTAKRRAKIVDLAFEKDYDCTCLYVKELAGICARRISKDDPFGTALRDVIKRQDNSFEEPNPKEGFSLITLEKIFGMYDTHLPLQQLINELKEVQDG